MPSLGGLLKRRRTKDSHTLAKDLQQSGSSLQTSPLTAAFLSLSPAATVERNLDFVLLSPTTSLVLMLDCRCCWVLFFQYSILR